MNRIDNDRFYISGIIDHGLTPQGLRWRSAHSQEIRFEQLFSLLPAGSFSIVDAGYGFGDLYHYISQRRNDIAYVGIDTLDIAVSEARDRTGATILHRDILYDSLPEADFYLCSGALNILTRQGAIRFIERCFYASKEGMIFNFLEGKKESNIYNYLQLSEMQSLGERLEAKMAFRRSYYESDCTVAFYKW
ncbi:MAG: class I SAM-dependent methyltransferase [Sulfuricurvum sp.]|jgi:SAM-dependent methyltransferase|uniref:class I SAM-dependent methyltransferase n=1 Tax=Sulfuricurvum sp. TaxID=2025608 RepID=UPI0025D6D338|nr:class I SAM-dependent methyltransferase [Sulfuricurvum sp.]MCI4406401.1 class I SAM-dependent methyltransferase [Sulfuricurvum sp.]